MKPSLMAQTCAGYVILQPVYGHYVEVSFQEEGTEQARARARRWLVNEGFVGLAAQTITLEPEVTKYLESI